jgi:hypothetical protein
VVSFTGSSLAIESAEAPTLLDVSALIPVAERTSTLGNDPGIQIARACRLTISVSVEGA